jgi:hypothetical protein
MMNGNYFKEGVHNLTDAAEVVLEGYEENHKQPGQEGCAGRDRVRRKCRNRWLPLTSVCSVSSVAADRTRIHVMSLLCSCSNMTVTVMQEV